MIDSWLCEDSGSQLWLYKTNSSWLESKTLIENPLKITGRILEKAATEWIHNELHPETYIEKNEFGKPELSTKTGSHIHTLNTQLPYINYSHTLVKPPISIQSSTSTESNNSTRNNSHLPPSFSLGNTSTDYKNNAESDMNIDGSINTSDSTLGEKSPNSVNTESKNCWVLWGANVNKAIGVDIESVRPQIEKIKSKFCRPEELEFCKTPIEMLLIWSAKEAMYKAYGRKAIDFREQMLVHRFTGFSGISGLEKQNEIHTDSNYFMVNVGNSEFSIFDESTIPQNTQNTRETIRMSGELWGDKHRHFSVFARCYDPFVVVWAIEIESC